MVEAFFWVGETLSQAMHLPRSCRFEFLKANFPRSQQTRHKPTRSLRDSPHRRTIHRRLHQLRRRYGELVKELTLAGDITPEESQDWSQQAKKAAELARKGDLAGAYREGRKAVGQMETALATR